MEKLKLEVGSGGNPTEGYLHLDVDPEAPHVEFRGDILALVAPHDYPPEENEGVMKLRGMKFAEIRAVHFIEHIPWIWIDGLFKLFYDLLEPGGRLYIEVPDGLYVMATALRSMAPNRLRWLWRLVTRRKKRFAFPVKEHPRLTRSGDPEQFWEWVNFKLFSGCSKTRDGRGDYHHSVFCVDFLRRKLEKAGFSVDSIKSKGGIIYVWATRPYLAVAEEEDPYYDGT